MTVLSHGTTRRGSSSVVAVALLAALTIVLSAVALHVVLGSIHQPSEPSPVTVEFEGVGDEDEPSYVVRARLTRSTGSASNATLRVVDTGEDYTLSTVGEWQNVTNASHESDVVVIAGGDVVATHTVEYPEWCIDDNSGHGNDCGADPDNPNKGSGGAPGKGK